MRHIEQEGGFGPVCALGVFRSDLQFCIQFLRIVRGFSCGSFGFACLPEQLQDREQNDCNKYQKDLSNWYNDLSYRQNEYNNAYAQRQQNVSSTLNGLFSMLGFAAQILPFFFI